MAGALLHDIGKLTEFVFKDSKAVHGDDFQLLRTSDIITLHVPLLDSTRHMIGAQELQSMKPGAILINTARGGLVDDTAFAAGKEPGHIVNRQFLTTAG